MAFREKAYMRGLTDDPIRSFDQRGQLMHARAVEVIAKPRADCGGHPRRLWHLQLWLIPLRQGSRLNQCFSRPYPAP